MPHDFIVDDFTQTVTFDPARACLVIVDMQYATGCRTTGLGALKTRQGREAEVAYRFDRIERTVLPNTVALLEAARASGLPRVHVTYGSELPDYADLHPMMRRICAATDNRLGLREHEIIDELKPEPGEPVVNKGTCDAFASSGIDHVLRAVGRPQLVFCGVSTNMCVEGTLRGASDRGWECLLVEDATGTDTQEFQDAAVAEMQRLFASVTTTAAILDALGTGGRSAQAAAAMVPAGVDS